MYHFFVPQDQIGEEMIEILGSDVNHIRNVLRMEAGDRLSVGNGVDLDYQCEIVALSPDRVTVKILSRGEEGSELPARLFLFQGLPKGDKMELIIQKAVELGAHQIVPVSTRRSVVKLDGKKSEARVRRWNGISESAAKQSGRSLIPEVTRVMSLKEALEHADSLDLLLIPYENARGMEAAREELSRVRAGMSAGIFIGPEGGFEYGEVQEAMNHGARPISLGRRILRTETAGLSVLSVLMFQLER